MIVKLLTEHHLELLSLKGGCKGSSESTYVKMQHCWKANALAHITFVLAKALKNSISLTHFFTIFKAMSQHKKCYECTNAGLHVFFKIGGLK